MSGDRILRLALSAYPHDARERDGEVLLDCARDVVEGGGSRGREALGLVGGGLRHRAGAVRHDAAAVPWRAGLVRAATPAASVSVALWSLNVVRGAGHERFGLVLLGCAAVALWGTAARRWLPALAGWSGVAALLGYDELLYGPGSRFSAGIATGYIDVIAAAVPLAVLGLATAVALRGHPARHWDAGTGRAAVAALPAAAVVAWVEVRDPLALTEWPVVVALLAPIAAMLVVRLALAHDAVRMTAAALGVAAAAPTAVWVSTGYLPYPGPAGAAGVLAGLGLGVALVLARMLQRAVRA